jgi:uncharacterized membrane protein YhaH (DUF805 family)
MLAFMLSPSGRFGRAKWWLAQLVTFIIIIVFIILLFVQFSGDDITKVFADRPNPSIDPVFVVELLVLALFLLWMTFCITVKRYHDRGKSGWWYLIQFIPFVGPIWAFIELGFCSGDDGDNNYGVGPDLNIADDLKTLRKQSGQPTPVTATSTYRPAPALRTSGPPVFGKRG